MSKVTQLLHAAEGGDRRAAADLLPLVYDELRRLAAQKLAQEKPGQTLEPTALVHEAYLRLIGPANVGGFENRRHFFAAAAEAMRRLLVETARRKQSDKRGGDAKRHDLDALPLPAGGTADPVELLALDEALTRLAAADPPKADLVKLRYFAGLSLEESAAALGVSPATAKRYWAFAKAWLFRDMEGRKTPAVEIPRNP